jgi:hypothetical protein
MPALLRESSAIEAKPSAIAGWAVEFGYMLGTIQSMLTGAEVTHAGQRFGCYRLNPMAG